MVPLCGELGRPVRAHTVGCDDVRRVGRERLCASSCPSCTRWRRRGHRGRRQGPRVQGATRTHCRAQSTETCRRYGICKTSAERRRFVRDTELSLLTVRTLRGLRNQETALFLRVWTWFFLLTITMTFGKVRVGTLDLYKTFAADSLVAASSVIEIRGVVEEADRAFATFLVEEHFERLPIYEGIIGQVYLSWSKLCT